MGFIKHFDDDMPCAIPDNINLYFPKSPADWLKQKEIKLINNWYVCFENKKETGKFKTLQSAKGWLNKL